MYAALTLLRQADFSCHAAWRGAPTAARGRVRCAVAISIVDAPSRAVAYNITKMQSSKIYVALLPVQNFFGMEVWNGIWKKILVWNGNGMEENCQYGIWKNRLPFHTMPWLPVVLSHLFFYKDNVIRLLPIVAYDRQHCEAIKLKSPYLPTCQSHCTI